MAGSIRIVIIDDHPVVREGVQRVLALDDRFEVVGEAGTCTEGGAIVASLQPDVAIIDVVLPDGDGIQLCRSIRAEHPQTACIMLTSYPEEDGLLSASVAGAAAYLPKESTTGIADAVVAAARGEIALDRASVQAHLDELSSTPATSVDSRLTRQERRVFELIGQGLSNRQISEQLHLTEKTVKNYVSRILAKLQMTRRTEAAILATTLRERRARAGARRLDS